ncbi:hypothetical protein J5N97_022436 [Dioscorea zingiberensis]|uniref:peroxidase n=1 Tax=Dioscorea zingiberensis TaxID=325984 RepID=A0A9D5HAN4_9LILI|nr:hypothetical protein J5N97_022436 [Dioscorea zingiberensis]
MGCLHVAILCDDVGDHSEALRSLDMCIIMGGPLLRPNLDAVVQWIIASWTVTNESKGRNSDRMVPEEHSKGLDLAKNTMIIASGHKDFFCQSFPTLGAPHISVSVVSEAQELPPVAKGLSYTFYKTSCPQVENIIRKHLKGEFKKDIGLAAGLLRVHFHDCFVQGCDGSVLLDGSASGPGEKDAPPNLTLRPSAFKAINNLKALIDKQCGRVVSCADITALAARDSIVLSGGPDYRVPLGRRDGLEFATREATNDGLPSPASNVTILLKVLSKLNLDATDLVALSGGHTIGLGHCSSFSNRLFPSQDTTMDNTFANNLYKTCPTGTTNKTTVLDIRSPNVFDNKYYADLEHKQGLFTSDQDLYIDKRTKEIVTSFSTNQALFFQKFVASMVKMGQLNVLTGNKGEIRSDCSKKNSKEGLWPIIVDGEEGQDFLAF